MNIYTVGGVDYLVHDNRLWQEVKAGDIPQSAAPAQQEPVKRRRGRQPGFKPSKAKATRRGRPPKYEKEVPLKDIHTYRCLDCGHQFRSPLDKLDAYCPMPTCNKASELEEIIS